MEEIDVVGCLVDYREELERLAGDYGLSDIRVFGSVARGTARPGSDLDLLVTASAGVGLMAVTAFGHVATDLLGVEVDVVTDGGVGPDHEVRRTAIPLAVLAQVEASRRAGTGRSGRPSRREQVDAAWAAEIARRAEELESGAVEGLTWDEQRIEESRHSGPGRTGHPVRREHMDAAQGPEGDGTELGDGEQAEVTLVDYLRADEPDEYELPAVTIDVPGDPDDA